ncbi:MAG: hypothetical protein ACNA8K_10700 [Cyclonatronaceae bacterium]
MKRFLYITPYFPPNNRVGALRPLKFVRHIHQFGWEPVIFCDMKLKDSVDSDLLHHIPDNLDIHRTYSNGAPSAWDAFKNGTFPIKKQKIAGPARTRNHFWNNPELIPYGEHLVDIPAAIRNGRKILKHTDCKAIVANIDPFAAAHVGHVLAREFNLPLVPDFRDPWAVCELRRPMRPLPVRKLVDRLERNIILGSSCIILNTDTALRDYRQHYSDLDPARFTCIRNSGDRNLINHGKSEKLPFRSMLFMGNLRRFIDGFEVLDVLAELKNRGVNPDTFRLVISGQVLPETYERARALGVEDMIHPVDPVPYTHVYPLMMSADILLVIAHNSAQRIPAKFYDYATTGKPIIAISENTELNRMVKRCNGRSFGFDSTKPMADYIQAVPGESKPDQTASTAGNMFSAEEGSRALAGILNKITYTD